jgi:hypothetical protein
MFKRSITYRAVFTTLALAGIILMIGCGALDQGPLAPARTAPSKALPRLALTDTYTQSDAELVSPTAEGLSLYSSDYALEVHFPEYGDAGSVRVESAYFTIQQGSVDQEALITMTAFSGSAVNDVRIKFGPDGLNFSRPATLAIVLRGPLNPERLKAYHTHSDGEVTEVPFELSSLGENHWRVTIQVSGFCTYSLGDDYHPPEGEGP